MSHTALLRSIRRWLMVTTVLLSVIIVYLFDSVHSPLGTAILLSCLVVATVAVIHLFVSFVQTPPWTSEGSNDSNTTQ